MKLTVRNDQVMIKSQSKPDFGSGKYGHWRKTASWEKSKVRALFLVGERGDKNLFILYALNYIHKNNIHFSSNT